MGLTDRAHLGAVKLLTFLSVEEVLSLCQTITNRQIEVHSHEEAVRAIVTYSQNAEELLRRKKLKRDALFKYLASEERVVDPNAEKHVLIIEILKHWGADSCTSKVEAHGSHQNTARDLMPQVGVHQSAAATQSNQSSVNNDDESFQFARTFSEWFYTMLNDCNPNCRKANGANFTSIHFYPDCRMKLLTQTNDVNQDDINGGDLVHLRLLAFSKDEQLLFNPNLEKDGVMGTRNPHGLTVVHVCGTVHRGSNVLGVFEQRFGLVKDPTMENNWRIKYTNLCLQAGDVLNLPKLGDGLAKMLPNSST